MESEGGLRGPVPVVYVPSPIGEIRQNILKLRNRGHVAVPKPTAPRAKVCIIVPGQPEDVEGVAKAVYDDVKHGNPGADIQLDEAIPCIHLTAPTSTTAMTLVDAARDLIDSYLAPPSTRPQSLFIEPPTDCAADYRIIVGPDAATRRVHCKLQVTDTNSDPVDAVNSYTEKIAEALRSALLQASRLNFYLVLRVSFGHYLLRNYKPGNYTLKGLEDMVTHPRATGLFAATLGENVADKLTMATVIKLIRATDSPLCPTDTQTPTAAQVLPTYTLEVYDDDWLYAAKVEDILRGEGDVNGNPKFIMLAAHVFPRVSQDPEFGITSVGLGKEFDWKISAVSGNVVPATSGQCQLVQRGLAGAISELRGTQGDYRSYPVVRLTNNGYAVLSRKLKSVVMKSEYNFSWKGSGYMVQFTIKRHWKDMREMVQAPPTNTTFELSVFGQNWDRDSKVAAGETVGRIWGNDLEGLLLDEPSKTALGRVQGLVRTIRDIRDAFDNAIGDGYRPEDKNPDPK
ncbi:hypothetical protein F5Y17DRAFT_2891 [Xylariaceae sp. FL0594]|nr:hypothetical protein F5Y17DRAFT_2891 [Xylariaceae sp. FL0594]